LRAVSAELRRTLHIAATGLTHCSRDLRYLSANPAYAAWIGLPLDHIIGRPGRIPRTSQCGHNSARRHSCDGV